jgi:hypothetical protein
LGEVAAGEEGAADLPRRAQLFEERQGAAKLRAGLGRLAGQAQRGGLRAVGDGGVETVAAGGGQLGGARRVSRQGRGVFLLRGDVGQPGVEVVVAARRADPVGAGDERFVEGRFEVGPA